MKRLFKSMMLSGLLLLGVSSIVGCVNNNTDGTSTSGSSVAKIIANGTYARPSDFNIVKFGGFEMTYNPALGETIVVDGESFSVSTYTGSNFTNYTYQLSGSTITLKTASGDTVPVEQNGVQTPNAKVNISQGYFYRNNKIEVEYSYTIVESTKENFPVGGGYTCLVVFTLNA